MPHVLWFIVGLLSGSVAMLGVLALCGAAQRGDEALGHRPSICRARVGPCSCTHLALPGETVCRQHRGVAV